MEWLSEESNEAIVTFESDDRNVWNAKYDSLIYSMVWCEENKKYILKLTSNSGSLISKVVL